MHLWQINSNKLYFATLFVTCHIMSSFIPSLSSSDIASQSYNCIEKKDQYRIDSSCIINSAYHSWLHRISRMICSQTGVSVELIEHVCVSHSDSVPLPIKLEGGCHYCSPSLWFNLWLRKWSAWTLAPPPRFVSVSLFLRPFAHHPNIVFPPRSAVASGL